MKFSEHLGAHLTPEWRSQYVQYEEMKKFIYEASSTVPASANLSDELWKSHFEKYDVNFFEFCDMELAKVNTFFAEKLSEAMRKFTNLQIQMANAGIPSLRYVVNSSLIVRKRDGSEAHFGTPVKPKTQTLSSKKLKEMKFVVSEFYLSLVLIQNFQQLNFTAFRKILKKHDKIFKTKSGAEYRVANIECSPFYTNTQINTLILDTESIAIDDLEGGNRTKAMNRLRVLPISGKQSESISFFWGFFSGLFLVLIAVVAVAAYYKGPNTNWLPALRMYRGILILYIMIGLLGINVRGWGRAGVNHVLIFELDPRHHLSYAEYLMTASMFGTLWCLSCLAFLFSRGFKIPEFAHPLALATFTLLYLINPTRTFQYRSRRWLLRVLLRIIVAPFKHVCFADFWLADQLNSLVIPLLDIQYLICFYTYDWYKTQGSGQCTSTKNGIRPIIALLPAWFRFAQCLRRYRDSKKAFPHLVNAGKYSTSMFVTILSTVTSVKDEANTGQRSWLFYVWIISLLISTFYTLFWDLKMDWGLFSKDAGENRFLREHIVYEYKMYYYIAMLSDVLLRFMWTLTVSVGNSGFLVSEFFTLFIAVVEIFRRFVWNFFRLENEHLNNVGEFRAVRDINIKPIQKQKNISSLTLEEIMDLEDGPPKKKLNVKNV
ncbi:solute carrier family 53 member 1 isoform X1 [Hydra vulgaris]|uniref:solute carrier family 53 member 1 isoform X1 n=1 Tax=Hydra vulgaris TaxID=6087 RepID=UPI0006416576|nr:xenotropic and polytropic retrovirus receptor 1 [Hydra vulgaris]XP_047134705.1 xenotropic and polytropic retrovirus receptor 1 [Hydra vulgaris]XP_047134706.1 xenotropic and polytropic retrovirus receptor 1 [Hydra vulgaris]XP_047134707.1 xenotropic and polytropic retrovirus receptor 1 [Hydra vulgaris]